MKLFFLFFSFVYLALAHLVGETGRVQPSEDQVHIGGDVGSVNINPISWTDISVRKSINILKVLISDENLEISNDFYLFKVFSKTYDEEFDPVLNEKVSVDFSGGSVYDLIQRFKKSAGSSISVAWSNNKIVFFPTGFSDQQILLRSTLFEVEDEEEMSEIPLGFLIELMNRRSKEKRLDIKVLFELDGYEGLERLFLDTSDLRAGDSVTVESCLLMVREQFILEVSLSADGDILLKDSENTSRLESDISVDKTPR